MKIKSFSIPFWSVGILAIGLCLTGLAYASTAKIKDVSPAAPIFKQSLQDAKIRLEEKGRNSQTTRPAPQQVAFITARAGCVLVTQSGDTCLQETCQIGCPQTSAPNCELLTTTPGCGASSEGTCQSQSTCISGCDWSTIAHATCSITCAGSTTCTGPPQCLNP